MVRKRQTGDLPLVSVVIPMCNEEGWVRRCLGSVQAQDYPAERIEILVADGMSTDGSRETLAEMAVADARLRVIDNPARIVPTGMNRAIRESRGDIVARIDAHTVIDEDYIRIGVDLLERSGASNVGGPMVCRGGSPVADAIAAAMHSRFGIGAQFHFATVETDADTVYMGMWPRSVFEANALFDEELVRNQDDELNYRIRKAGGRIVLSPAMVSSYQNRESWGKLARQFYQYGEWKVRVLQKHPRQMSLRHFVPPAFQAGLLVAVASALVCGGSWAFLSLAAGLAVAGYAVVLAAVAGRAAPTWPAGLRMAVALAIIHQAWGAGFLVGLIRFAPRWLQTEPAPPLLTPASSGPAR